MASFKFGALIERVSTTATAAGTTTLLNNSSTYQQFTGTLAQTVQLPDATTMANSMRFVIQNRSTGVITVNDGSPALLTTVAAGFEKTIQLYDKSTVAGTWDVSTSQPTSGVGLGANSTVAINPSGQSPFTMTLANSNGKVFLVNSANGAMQFNLPAPATSANLIFTVKDVGGLFNTNACTMNRNAAESIEGLAANYLLEANWGHWTFSCNGTNWFVTAG